MRPQPAVVLFLALACVLSFAQGDKARDAGVSAAADSSYVPVHKFDPTRDAAADIHAAIAEAQKTGKAIILDVGGDWCRYCHQMDQLFQDHAELAELREKNFITVNIYYGSDKKNEQVLAHYSKVLGVPHFFVLDKDGTLLHSQHVRDLREGGKYSPEKMKEFLTRWSPPHAGE
jgi:thiol:disulfide interchange protein